MRTAIHVDDAPRMRPGDIQDEETLELGHVHELESGRVEEGRSGSRLTIHQR
jgi:hypothetical protein